MKRLAIDFDGVMRAEDGGPVPGALETMEKLAASGYEPYVFTLRGENQDAHVQSWIASWQVTLGLPHRRYEVTDAKQRDTLAYLDDRAVRFTTWADFGRMYM